MTTDEAIETVKWLEKTRQPKELLTAALVLAQEVKTLRNRLATKESERQFLKGEIRRLRKSEIAGCGVG